MTASISCLLTIVCTVSALAATESVVAQVQGEAPQFREDQGPAPFYRADQAPSFEPAPRAAPEQPRDIAPLFADAYRRSGQPRIALFWNRELNDKTQTAMLDKSVTREVGKSSSTGMTKSTNGPAESATSKDADDTFDRTKTVTNGRQAAEESTRAMPLGELGAALLQRGFVSEMTRGDVRFVDRALAMRLEAAAHHRDGGDAKLIETDALLSRSDLMMEVLLVKDGDTPLGIGFDVRVKDLKRGYELTSFYSRALPFQRPPEPAKWVPGANGFELRRPAPPASPTPQAVGAALARDVMLALGSNLEAISADTRASTQRSR